MLDSFLAVKQPPRIINDYFQILLFCLLFITWFSFAWESYDKTTVHQPNLVLRSYTVDVPALQEPPDGYNQQLYFSPLFP